ncbi:MAG: hypothetical protein DI539_05755 [Flavobacterium psychrophilum]|nr:MAG: hypothetical protein DI539_05755 [Flavobacterium psychrophilum]
MWHIKSLRFWTEIDNKTKSEGPDRDRINTSEVFELHYFSKKFWVYHAL